MINQYKWINSLPKTNIKFNEKENQADHSRWVNTIPQKNTYNSVAWKYPLLSVLFVCGLLCVSAIKNETRNLEKEIDNLRVSNKVIKFNLDQAILDNEVITSPENISRLAKEYLNTNYVSYKKSQIKNIDDDDALVIPKLNNTKNKLTKKIQLEMVKKIESKKTEIRKLQELYSKPESIPDEIKTQVAIKIKEKKTQLKKLYSSPKETFAIEKVQKWVAVQVVKVFLGMPVIPGK